MGEAVAPLAPCPRVALHVEVLDKSAVAAYLDFQRNVRSVAARFVITTPCPNCGRQGTVLLPATLRVPVPAGVEAGHRLRVDGQGHSGLGRGVSGDLYIKIDAPTDIFERDGQT